VAKPPLIVQQDDQSDEEFWAEHDPYGDRFSKKLPRWSCCLIILAVMAAVAAGAYLLLR
jgi:hypothetical protein